MEDFKEIKAHKTPADADIFTGDSAQMPDPPVLADQCVFVEIGREIKRLQDQIEELRTTNVNLQLVVDVLRQDYKKRGEKREQDHFVEFEMDWYKKKGRRPTDRECRGHRAFLENEYKRVSREFFWHIGSKEWRPKIEK